MGSLPFSRGSSWPREWTQGHCIAGRLFTSEPPGKHVKVLNWYEVRSVNIFLNIACYWFIKRSLSLKQCNLLKIFVTSMGIFVHLDFYFMWSMCNYPTNIFLNDIPCFSSHICQTHSILCLIPGSERIHLQYEETRVRFLGWEDPLENKMETHSSVLAWEIPWTEEPEGLVDGVTKSRTQASN